MTNASGGTQVQLNWYVDGNLYETQTGGWSVPSGAPAGNTNAPFDQSFYIIMNLAVGGSYTNYQTPGVGTYDMKVGYVSAYQAAVPEPAVLGFVALAAGALVLSSRGRRALCHWRE